jgi:hypothetical protein
LLAIRLVDHAAAVCRARPTVLSGNPVLSFGGREPAAGTNLREGTVRVALVKIPAAGKHQHAAPTEVVVAWLVPSILRRALRRRLVEHLAGRTSAIGAS